MMMDDDFARALVAVRVIAAIVRDTTARFEEPRALRGAAR
jgi:hypothetical protein